MPPYLDVRLEVRINGLFHLVINGVTLGWNNPLIPTFDPNFQRHIQVQQILKQFAASFDVPSTRQGVSEAIAMRLLTQ